MNPSLVHKRTLTFRQIKTTMYLDAWACCLLYHLTSTQGVLLHNAANQNNICPNPENIPVITNHREFTLPSLYYISQPYDPTNSTPKTPPTPENHRKTNKQ